MTLLSQKIRAAGLLYTIPKFARRIGRSKQRVYFIVKNRETDLICFNSDKGPVHASVVTTADGKTLLSEQIHIKAQ